MSKKRVKIKDHIIDNDIDENIGPALFKEGYRVPMTEEEVNLAESEQQIPTPQWLHSPPSLDDPTDLNLNLSSKIFPKLKSIENQMTRAARLGKEITPEIGERMQQDRKRAEKEFDYD